MEWFEEVYSADWRQRLKIDRVVHRERTDHQEVLIFDSPMFGRVLALDGILQTTERDEFIYHEMIAHVPMIAHGGVREVLIIGGGDGGSLEEVLKHAALERATVVELDPRVVELSRTFLASICKGAFDDPRTRLLFTDGLAFLAGTAERFDVIIVDSTDPFGLGEALFDERFYADCRARLRPGGVVVHQGGNPFSEWPRFAAGQRRLGRVFSDANFYWTAVPTYYGGPFVFGWGSDEPATRCRRPDELARRAVPEGLRWYTPAVHVASFTHPPWLGAWQGERDAPLGEPVAP